MHARARIENLPRHAREETDRRRPETAQTRFFLFVSTFLGLRVAIYSPYSSSFPSPPFSRPPSPARSRSLAANLRAPIFSTPHRFARTRSRPTPILSPRLRFSISHSFSFVLYPRSSRSVSQILFVHYRPSFLLALRPRSPRHPVHSRCPPSLKFPFSLTPRGGYLSRPRASANRLRSLLRAMDTDLMPQWSIHPAAILVICLYYSTQCKPTAPFPAAHNRIGLSFHLTGPTTTQSSFYHPMLLL